MPEGRQEFGLLIERVRGGSQQAVEELLERYEPHVLRAVRRKLNKQLRSKFDSLDFVQSVWGSVLSSRLKAGTFESPEELIGYLTTMATNKVMQEFRRYLLLEKCNVLREHSLESSILIGTDALISRQPTPSQFAMAQEQWSRLLRAQPAPYRRILELRGLGNTCRRIAQELGLNEKTVRRVLRKFTSDRVR